MISTPFKVLCRPGFPADTIVFFLFTAIKTNVRDVIKRYERTRSLKPFIFIRTRRHIILFEIEEARGHGWSVAERFRFDGDHIEVAKHEHKVV